jgi:protein O-GlcNAc transferase
MTHRQAHVPHDLMADLEKAYAHHSAGRIAEAESGYLAILERMPGQVDALYLLSSILLQSRPELALEKAREAVAASRGSGGLGVSEAMLQDLLAQVVSVVLLDPALELGHRCAAMKIDPANADRLFRIADLQRQVGQIGEATATMEKYLRSRPGDPNARANLGGLLVLAERHAEAVGVLRAAVSAAPGHLEAWINLGAALDRTNDLTGAVEAFQRALTVDPERLSSRPAVRADLARTLLETWQNAAAWTQLAALIDELPADPKCWRRVLMTLLYFDQLDSGGVRQMHERYGRLLGEARKPEGGRPFVVPRDRRLRVGLVSGDFRTHACASFILPLLEGIDRKQAEITAYDTTPGVPGDPVAARLRVLADHWRDLSGRSIDEAARIVREDQVDILVDLSGHTDGHLLPLFACRPAPRAVTWLGYPATTGLQSIDLRLTDTVADPPEEGNAHATEALIRLERGFLCYTPLTPAPPIGPVPQRPPVFGSFSNLAKVTPGVLGLWLEILGEIPDATLYLKARSLGEEAVRNRVLDFAAKAGIESHRLRLEGWRPLDAYLASYADIDIALDPFPYNGTTTTCEALIMGVPVVSLRGNSHRARVGASLLTQVGRSEWIAETPGDYRSIACRQAGGVEAIRSGRQALRDQVMGSPLCDARDFAQRFVEAIIAPGN